MHIPFKQVVEEAVELQNQLPWLEVVAVGGTAAAIHARHRYSVDADFVTPFLKENFEVVGELLDRWDGWKTNRINRPVVILGERHGVELGVRQLRRSVALDTTVVDGLVVPTPQEALRIKAFLLSQRKATRDYVDVAALCDHVGLEEAAESLRHLNTLYAPEGNLSRLSAFSQQCHAQPVDLHPGLLESYKGVRPPYQEWDYVARRCKDIAAKMHAMEMDGGVPKILSLPLPQVSTMRGGRPPHLP